MADALLADLTKNCVHVWIVFFAFFLAADGLLMTGKDFIFFFLLAPLFGVINLICYVPMIGKMLLRKNQWLHKQVTSDIPGNPHAFDDAIISMMRTLPEPSNFNICWSGVRLKDPLLVEGVIPPAAINSISVYSRTTNDSPVTLDMSTVRHSPGKAFRVFLSPQSLADDLVPSGARIHRVTYPDHWDGGFIAMRNFAVENGTRVVTPTVSSLSGDILRPSKALVAGLTASKGLEVEKVFRVAVFNGILVLSRACQVSWPMMERITVLGGLVMGFTLYRLLFSIGKKGLNKHISQICPRLHVFNRPDDSAASEASQPSQEHRYWLMRFDLNSLSGRDIVVKSSIKVDGQKYWSFSVYDVYGIPIPQYVNLNNVECNPSDSTYEVSIRLSLAPMPNVTDSPSSGKARATVDMKNAPVGYAIFRIVHPTSSDTVQMSAPVASLTNANLR